MTAPAAIRFDAAALRFDPPGVRPPKNPWMRAICRRVNHLLAADRNEWRKRYEPYFGPDRRRERREAIVLLLKTAISRADHLTGNVYTDGGRADARGISIPAAGRLCALTFDRVKEAFGDLKTAGIEQFDRCAFETKRGTMWRRLPKAQPRNESTTGTFTAMPAIRCLSWKAIGHILGCQFSVQKLREKAYERRKKAPISEREKRTAERRAARARAWREARKRTGGSAVATVVAGTIAKLAHEHDLPEEFGAAEREMLRQLEQAKLAILIEHRRAGAREVPSDEWIEAEALRRIGAPVPRRLE